MMYATNGENFLRRPSGRGGVSMLSPSDGCYHHLPLPVLEFGVFYFVISLAPLAPCSFLPSSPLPSWGFGSLVPGSPLGFGFPSPWGLGPAGLSVWGLRSGILLLLMPLDPIGFANVAQVLPTCI